MCDPPGVVGVEPSVVLDLLHPRSAGSSSLALPLLMSGLPPVRASTARRCAEWAGVASGSRFLKSTGHFYKKGQGGPLLQGHKIGCPRLEHLLNWHVSSHRSTQLTHYTYTCTLGHFACWISLSPRPKTETKRLNFGLSPEFRLTNHHGAHHCPLRNVIADCRVWFSNRL